MEPKKRKTEEQQRGNEKAYTHTHLGIIAEPLKSGIVTPLKAVYFTSASIKQTYSVYLYTMDRNSTTRGVCYAFQKNECTRGSKCKFAHELANEATKKRKHEEADLADVISSHQGVVLLGDKAVTESVPKYVPPPKLKKPKHLKRKIQQAEQITDDQARAEVLLKVEKEKADLGEYKKDAAKMWKKTCQKLVKKSLGEDKWDEERFQELVRRKVGKDAFLLALGVPAHMHKEK